MEQSALNRVWRPLGFFLQHLRWKQNVRLKKPLYFLMSSNRQTFPLQTQIRNCATDETSKERDFNSRFSGLSDAEKEAKATEVIENLSDNDKKKLLALQMEYDVWMSTGVRVPANMTNSTWLQAFNQPSSGQRRKLYNYLLIVENSKKKDLEKKSKRHAEHLKRTEEKRRELETKARAAGYPDGRLPPKETILMYLRVKTMLQHYYNNLAWSMQYGQNLVFDVSFEDTMKDRELSSLLSQMRDSYATNKVQQEPFHWHITGLKPGGAISNAIEGESLDLGRVPMTVTSKSYLDIFPKEKLVYLTPDAKTELHRWDHDAVYIVGALVDLADQKPVTFSKARREGIRAVKLPLDKYCKWEVGTKALTLNQMMSILCDIKESGDWTVAFKHVPKRKAVVRAQYDPEYKKLMGKKKKVKIPY